MLRNLRVRDFAIISELILEPGRGLNVFTGETGAGKSILIEALGFLLGARATTAWLRAGVSRLVSRRSCRHNLRKLLDPKLIGNAALHA